MSWWKIVYMFGLINLLMAGNFWKPEEENRPETRTREEGSNRNNSQSPTKGKKLHLS